MLEISENMEASEVLVIEAGMDSRNFIDINSKNCSSRQQISCANNITTVWERVQKRLRVELGEDVYSSWFKCLELIEFDGATVYFSVPTKFLRNWIQQHFLEKIQVHFRFEQAEIKNVVIVLRAVGQRIISKQVTNEFNPRDNDKNKSNLQISDKKAAISNSFSNVYADVSMNYNTNLDSKHVDAKTFLSNIITDGESQVGSPLDRRFTLSSFQVGRSNSMAHAAAMQVVQMRAGDHPVFNPLFIHANVGLGKTHLLQGAAQAMEANGRKVLYLTAERFMYGFVSSLKAQTAMAFKEHLRAIDVLLVDDIQFLHGQKSQQEFCHILNSLVDSGKQVIVAADRPPTELEGLDERVQSRLAGGLVLEIGALDEALRVKILENRIQLSKAHMPNFEVSKDVVLHVAQLINTNGRDLEGAVNRLLAHMTLTGGELTNAIAEEAIKDLIRHREVKRVKIEEIQRLVANHYNVSRADILSSRRTATVVRPRQIAMYLSKFLTLRSLPEIGRRFGGRDHTTVLHAVRKIEGLSTNDHEFANELEHLKRMLQE